MQAPPSTPKTFDEVKESKVNRIITKKSEFIKRIYKRKRKTRSKKVTQADIQRVSFKIKNQLKFKTIKNS